MALTTYDYAHPDVYVRQVAAVSSQVVSQRVRAATTDFQFAMASSLGDVTGVKVASLTDSQGEVLVDTLQVVSDRYAVVRTNLTGLLDVTVSRSGEVWLVSDYRWLLTPSSGP